MLKIEDSFTHDLHVCVISRTVAEKGVGRLAAERMVEILDSPREITRITDHYIDITLPVGRFRLFFDNSRVSFCRTECLECFEELGYRCGERNLCFVPLEGPELQGWGASNCELFQENELYFFAKLYSILSGEFPTIGCDVQQQIKNATEFKCDRERLKLLSFRKSELIRPHLIKVTRQVPNQDSLVQDERDLTPDILPCLSIEKKPHNIEVDYLFKLLLFFDDSKRARTFLSTNFSELLEQQVENIVGVNFSTEKISLSQDSQAKILIWALSTRPQFEFLHRIYYNGASGLIFLVDYAKLTKNPSYLEKLIHRVHDVEECVPGIPSFFVLLKNGVPEDTGENDQFTNWVERNNYWAESLSGLFFEKKRKKEFFQSISRHVLGDISK